MSTLVAGALGYNALKWRRNNSVLRQISQDMREQTQQIEAIGTLIALTPDLKQAARPKLEMIERARELLLLRGASKESDPTKTPMC